MRSLRFAGLLLFLASAVVVGCSTSADLSWDETTGDDDDDDDGGGTLVLSTTDEINECRGITSIVGNTFTLTASLPLLVAGDLLFLLRTQDSSTLTASATPSPGEIDASHVVAGQYAIVTVDNASSQNVTVVESIDGSLFGTESQVCTFPVYESVEVTALGRLQAPSWDGTSGGLVAFRTASLVIDGAIDAEGAGFRGGSPNTAFETFGGGTTNDLPCANSGMANGGRKGEGVAGAHPLCGRAFFATGAGGGNSPRGGGAGGGNGGRGGMGHNPSTYPTPCGTYPSCSLPGAPIATALADRIFLGGGGGGGHSSAADDDGSGAAGGGIIFIQAETISGSGSVTVAGSNGNDTTSNGAGGGGAGGTIYIDVAQPSSLTLLQARGGDGGSVATSTGCTAPFGVGGPGGGGRIILRGAGSLSATKSTLGGIQGTLLGSCGSGGSFGTAAQAGDENL